MILSSSTFTRVRDLHAATDCSAAQATGIPVGETQALGRATAERSRRWLTDMALPLWGQQGFDTANGHFHEFLDFSGKPVPSSPRRVMVQARQISVYSRAALEDGYAPGRNLALTAADTMVKRWLAADGAPGWVFSVTASGAVVDTRRDLYAHAFVIFGLAWALRLEPNPRFTAAIDDTLRFLDDAFFDPAHGGYWDRLPGARDVRSQNPHMHLFEALIELYEITGNASVLERCRVLDKLATERFISRDHTCLRESFHGDWSVAPGEGEGRVEPGHLMEWAWLLARFEAHAKVDRSDFVQPLIATALARGTDRARGRMIDEFIEDGRGHTLSSRSWPHAEACKALASEILRGHTAYAPDLIRIARRLHDTHCPTDLNGGWIDRVDAREVSMSKMMPASTFYHIYNGLKAVISAFPDA